MITRDVMCTATDICPICRASGAVIDQFYRCPDGQVRRRYVCVECYDTSTAKEREFDRAYRRQRVRAA